MFEQGYTETLRAPEMASFSLPYSRICGQDIVHIYSYRPEKPAAVRKPPPYKPDLLADQVRDVQRLDRNKLFMEYITKYDFELPRAAAFHGKTESYISKVVARLHRDKPPDFAKRFGKPRTPNWFEEAEEKKKRLKHVIHQFGGHSKKHRAHAKLGKHLTDATPIHHEGVPKHTKPMGDMKAAKHVPGLHPAGHALAARPPKHPAKQVKDLEPIDHLTGAKATNKPVKPVQDEKPAEQSEDANRTKQGKEHKKTKYVVDAKQEKQPVEAQQTKPGKDQKKPKQTTDGKPDKQSVEAKQTKHATDAMPNNPEKDLKKAKHVSDGKPDKQREGKPSKHLPDIKAAKPEKDVKPGKAETDAKEEKQATDAKPKVPADAKTTRDIPDRHGKPVKYGLHRKPVKKVPEPTFAFKSLYQSTSPKPHV